MKPNALLRTATLSLFVLLMSGFVAYKAGAFEVDNATTNGADSPKKDSATGPTMAPSTKSAVIFEPQTTKDTSKPQQQQQQKQSNQAPNQNNNAPANQSTSPAPKPNNVYMGSSKSAPVFTPSRDTNNPK